MDELTLKFCWTWMIYGTFIQKMLQIFSQWPKISNNINPRSVQLISHPHEKNPCLSLSVFVISPYEYRDETLQRTLNRKMHRKIYCAPLGGSAFQFGECISLGYAAAAIVRVQQRGEEGAGGWRHVLGCALHRRPSTSSDEMHFLSIAAAATAVQRRLMCDSCRALFRPATPLRFPRLLCWQASGLRRTLLLCWVTLIPTLSLRALWKFQSRALSLSLSRQYSVVVGVRFALKAQKLHGRSQDEAALGQVLRLLG